MEWLRWRRVTHVLNWIGPVDPSTGDADPSYVLAVASPSDDIQYVDW